MQAAAGERPYRLSSFCLRNKRFAANAPCEIYAGRLPPFLLAIHSLPVQYVRRSIRQCCRPLWTRSRFVLRSLLLRWLLLSLAVAFTDWLLPGFIIYQGAAGVAIVAALLGIVNAVIRPIVKLLTCPLIFFTLGLFSLVINALMLIIVQQLRPDLIYLENFTTTLIASIIISIASAVLNMTLYDGRRYRR